MVLGVSDAVIGSVDKFLDITMVIVAVMLIYYIVKFFMVEPPTKADRAARVAEDEEKRKKIKKTLDEMGEKQTKKAAAQSRKKLLEPAKGFLIRAYEAAEELRDDELKVKNEASVRKAEGKLEDLESNLNKAKHILKHVKRHAKGDMRDFFVKLYDSNEVALKVISEHLENKIPEASSIDWIREVANVRTSANHLMTVCGYMIKVIEDFIDAEKKEINVPSLPSPPSSGPSGGPSGGRPRIVRPAP